ncbi:hypothetical protein Tco_0965831 [Tanacetum coccineum]
MLPPSSSSSSHHHRHHHRHHVHPTTIIITHHQTPPPPSQHHKKGACGFIKNQQIGAFDFALSRGVRLGLSEALRNRLGLVGCIGSIAKQGLLAFLLVFESAASFSLPCFFVSGI